MKKLLAILLALTTVLVLFAACGGTSEEGTETTAPAETTQEVSLEETTAAEADAEETTAEEASEAGDAAAYADAAEVLSTVWATYEDDNKFPIGGGDSENLTMDAPGKFNVAMTEELDVTLALPASQHGNIEDAASMMNMMNANMFTCAAYRVKADTDVAAFAEDYQTGLNSRQWMCGFPEKFVVIKTGDFVITAFGNGDNIDNFTTKATTALEGAEIVAEDIIAI